MRVSVHGVCVCVCVCVCVFVCLCVCVSVRVCVLRIHCTSGESKAAYDIKVRLVHDVDDGHAWMYTSTCCTPPRSLCIPAWIGIYNIVSVCTWMCTPKCALSRGFCLSSCVSACVVVFLIHRSRFICLTARGHGYTGTRASGVWWHSVVTHRVHWSEEYPIYRSSSVPVVFMVGVRWFFSWGGGQLVVL